LWERFEELLLSGDTPDEGETMAMAHYADHQVEMDAGAVVSWPAVRPLVRLMIKRARDGHPAFDSEQQNDPISGDDAPFANSIRFWVNRLAEWKFYGAVDPSMGRQAAGRDPSAVLVGGFDRERGILDVVHAQIRRRTPDKLIEDIIECQREWACIVWGFEAVVFAEFVRTELVKRSAAAGVPVPARPLNPISDKPLRIESLQPHMHNGLLRLHSSQTTLIDQFRHYPKADHDDGPDAAQMLWMLAITGGIGAGTQVEDTTARGREYFDRAARQAQRMFTRRR
ncbi:MAG: phage terminase large subunit, partial [Rubrivivax sp.]|nr:phage terminase large subunit [Rubrivivax sp.]